MAISSKIRKGRKTATANRRKRAVDKLAAEIGVRMSEARLRAGFETIASLHRQTTKVDPDKQGISQPVLKGYEGGNFRPGARELILLSKALGETPNWLLLGEANPKEIKKPATQKSEDVADILRVTPTEKRATIFALMLDQLEDKQREAIYVLLEAAVRQKLGKRFDLFFKMYMRVADIITDPAGPAVKLIAGLGQDFENSASMQALAEEIKAEQAADPSLNGDSKHPSSE